MSLARQNIRHDFPKFLGACSILCGAALLIYLFSGPLIAQLETVGKIERHFDADLIVSDDVGEDTEKILLASMGLSYTRIDERIELVLLGYPEVSKVEAISNARRSPNWTWTFANGASSREKVYVFNTETETMGYPLNFGNGLREALNVPLNVAVFKNTNLKTHVSLDQWIDVNGLKVRVVGFVNPTQTDVEGVIMSSRTARLIDSRPPPTDMFLIKARPGTNIKFLKARLSRDLAQYGLTVGTPEDRSKTLGRAFLLGNLGSIFAANISGSLLIAIITGLTLKSLLLSYRNEFACLRALGVSGLAMASVAIETSLWLAILSILFSTTCIWIIATMFQSYGIAFSLPPEIVVSVASFIFFTSLLSGVATLPSLLRIQPTELLR